VSVLYEAALLGTIAVVGWIVLDVLSDPVRRRRLESVGVLALSALAWASGELLLQHATGPENRIAIRRVLFAGVCTLPAAWVWCARAAAHPHETWGGRRFFAVFALPGLLAWSCLFWDRSGLFIDWYAVPSERGPLFLPFAIYAWAMITWGAWVLLRAAPRRAEGRPGTRIAIVAGAFLPVLANAEHVIFHATVADPTPIALGLAALLFRGLVLDLAFASAQPPLARAEVMGQMRDGVLVADLAGRIFEWNAASEVIVGSRTLEGSPLGALLADLRRRRGREVEIRSFPLTRRGRTFALGVVLVDRTELRRSELRLEMATRHEALGVLASGVAHEINNPLTYVSANLTLLDPLVTALDKPEVRAALPADLRGRAYDAPDLIADCREGTERIQRIVEKLALFTERGATSDAARPHDVSFPVQKALAMVGFGKPGWQIPVVRPDWLPPAVAVESDVVHIVLHLLLNAFQMGGEHVPIQIELGADERGVQVRVADGGPGIPEADLPHVFDPFFTTRRPGPNLGLGLSLCWELARRNGGRLEAENQTEGGAAFTLWLPLAEA
jgi:signal transduction histidine kinase